MMNTSNNIPVCIGKVLIIFMRKYLTFENKNICLNNILININ